MTKLGISTALFFWTLSALADPPHSTTGIPIYNAPVTQGGVWQAQENLKKQNALTGETNSDSKFGVRNLQQKADSETSKVTPQQKNDLYNLGSEILPFVAPYINEIAKACIDKVDLQSASAEARVGDCAKQAVAQFQKDPAAFIDRMPASEKQRLQTIVNARVKESVRPVNKPGTMQP